MYCGLPLNTLALSSTQSLDSQLASLRRNAQFTQQVYRHGLYEDTTMEGHARKQKNKKKAISTRVSNHRKLAEEFEQETQKIIQKQEQLAKSQKKMAWFAIVTYSATHIQAIFRGFRIRKKIKLLRQKMFLSLWRMFRNRLRVLLGVKTKIGIAIFSRIIVCKRVIQHKIQLKKQMSANIIQRQFRGFFSRKKLMISKFVDNSFKPMLMIGYCKGVQKNSVYQKFRYVFNKFVIPYCRMKRMRSFVCDGSIRYFFLEVLLKNEDQSMFRYIQRRSSILAAQHKIIQQDFVYKNSNTSRKAVYINQKQIANDTPRQQLFKENIDPLQYLSGFFRLKSIYDCLNFITDLIQLASLNTNLLSNPLEIEVVQMPLTPKNRKILRGFTNSNTPALIDPVDSQGGRKEASQASATPAAKTSTQPTKPSFPPPSNRRKRTTKA